MAVPTCRACKLPLTTSTVGRGAGAASVGRCGACGGVAVEIRHLVPLLEALTKELRKSMDLNQPIAPVNDPRRKDPCPRCGNAMESFGYMGTKLAWPQRCGPCLQIWIDQEQMGALCLVYARTSARREEASQHARDEAEGMDRRTRLAAAGRRAGDLLGGGMLG